MIVLLCTCLSLFGDLENHIPIVCYCLNKSLFMFKTLNEVLKYNFWTTFYSTEDSLKQCSHHIHNVNTGSMSYFKEAYSFIH